MLVVIRTRRGEYLVRVLLFVVLRTQREGFLGVQIVLQIFPEKFFKKSRERTRHKNVHKFGEIPPYTRNRDPSLHKNVPKFARDPSWGLHNTSILNIIVILVAPS